MIELYPLTRSEAVYRGTVGLRGYDAKAVSEATSIDTGSESSVQQQFGQEVDINTIVRRFGISRTQPSGAAGGVYGDFTGIHDYESAQAAVDRARDGFMALPPEVREKFRNDPGAYLEHVDQMTDEELEAEYAPPVAPVAPVVPVVPA